MVMLLLKDAVFYGNSKEDYLHNQNLLLKLGKLKMHEGNKIGDRKRLIKRFQDSKIILRVINAINYINNIILFEYILEHNKSLLKDFD